jgi:hypothetical protein
MRKREVFGSDCPFSKSIRYLHVDITSGTQSLQISIAWRPNYEAQHKPKYESNAARHGFSISKASNTWMTIFATAALFEKVAMLRDVTVLPELEPLS